MIARLKQLSAGLAGALRTFLQPKKSKGAADREVAAKAADERHAMAETGIAMQEDAGALIRTAVTPSNIPESTVAKPPIGNIKRHAEIKRAIEKLDVLPAMPIIAQRLLALNLDSEEGERMLLVLIAQDPQISAKILGLANSAMVGASRKITTVREAAILLGTKRIQSIATGIAIISLMSKAPAGEFNIHDLWLESFRVAFAMQGIARIMPASMRPHEDQIVLAGMLHDIGFLVLAYIDPKLSDKLHNHRAAQPERPALEVEREILEIGHDELGAELASHWNLPEEIIAVLRYHHYPEADGAAVGQPLVRMVNIAERLLLPVSSIEYVTAEISAGEWEALGINPSQATEVKALVDEQAEQAIQFASSFT